MNNSLIELKEACKELVSKGFVNASFVFVLFLIVLCGASFSFQLLSIHMQQRLGILMVALFFTAITYAILKFGKETKNVANPGQILKTQINSLKPDPDVNTELYGSSIGLTKFKSDNPKGGSKAVKPAKPSSRR